MLSTTLRRLVSISGRTILAIGLTSATVLALAPSAKAGTGTDTGEVSIENPLVNTVTYAASGSSTIAQFEGAGGAEVGTITVENNSGTAYTLKASSVGGVLTHSDTTTTLAYKIKTVAGTGAGTYVGILATVPTSASPLLIYTGVAADLGSKTIKLYVKPDLSFSTVRAGVYTDTITYTIANGL